MDTHAPLIPYLTPPRKRWSYLAIFSITCSAYAVSAIAVSLAPTLSLTKAGLYFTLASSALFSLFGLLAGFFASRHMPYPHRWLAVIGTVASLTGLCGFLYLLGHTLVVGLPRV
jgi:peptidoglycan/LPS O-acetylase OafA/YrhL